MPQVAVLIALMLAESARAQSSSDGCWGGLPAVSLALRAGGAGGTGAGGAGGATWVRLTFTAPAGCDWEAAGVVTVALNRTLAGGATLRLQWPLQLRPAAAAAAGGRPSASAWLPAEANTAYAASALMWRTGASSAAGDALAATAWAPVAELAVSTVACSADGVVAALPPPDGAPPFTAHWAAAWGAAPPPAGATGFVRVFLAGFDDVVAPASMVSARRAAPRASLSAAAASPTPRNAPPFPANSPRASSSRRRRRRRCRR
jgi:hypothetical protein